MNSEDHMLHRVEPPQFFLAPSNQDEAECFCKECGQPILAGELIAEVDDEFGVQFVHERCVNE